MSTKRECKWCRPWNGMHTNGCPNKPPTYESMKRDKRYADAHTILAELQAEYDSVHDPDYESEGEDE